MNTHWIVSKVHKWVGIVLGVQILLWMLGGFFMSWFPIQEVRGEHLRAQTSVEKITPTTHSLDVIKTLLDAPLAPVISWHAEHLNGQGVYRVLYEDQSTALHNSLTGAAIKPFSKEYIRNTALQLYGGTGDIVSLTRLDQTEIEYRGSLPVWKVDFSDEDDTSFYISDASGELVAVRTDAWRLYDFMWMLHIMDYEDRADFNHPLLYLTSLVAVLFTVTGFVLFFIRRKISV